MIEGIVVFKHFEQGDESLRAVLFQEKCSWPRGYKTFSMLNSAEHEILNAHKYKNIKKFSIF